MTNFDAYNTQKADNSKLWLLFLLLGWSYGSLGSMGKQILFYLTLGGFGMWTLYRMFTLNKAIKKYNRQIAINCGLDSNDLLKLNLI
jgi:hypothetical protein